MKNYVSYIDTALRVIHINRNLNYNDQNNNHFIEFIKHSETSAHVKSHALHENLKFQLASDIELNNLLLHESFHYWQTLFYPFLYYINWREFDDILTLREEIKYMNEDKISIGQIRMHDKMSFNLKYCSTKFYLYWTGDRLFVREMKNTDVSSDVFCLNDFIEDAATIFQYNVTESRCSSENYHKWIQNPDNKGYKRLYKFIRKKMGNEFAYKYIPMLVQLAFYTTEPISSFCNAVSLLNYEFYDYEDYSLDKLFDLLLERLKVEFGVVKIDNENERFIQHLPVGLFTHNEVEDLIKQEEIHRGRIFFYPIELHVNKLIKILSVEPNRKYQLFHYGKESVEFLMEQFFPMATHFYFLEISGRNSSLFVSPDFHEITPMGVPYDFYIKEILKVKETTQAIFTNIQNQMPHNCHHKDCSYYNLNICRKWNAIPHDYNRCSFSILVSKCLFKGN